MTKDIRNQFYDVEMPDGDFEAEATEPLTSQDIARLGAGLLRVAETTYTQDQVRRLIVPATKPNA